MIKARGQHQDGAPMMFLGLSAENIARLLEDKPIIFNTADLGLPPMHVAILYGETEEIIAADLAKALRETS